MSNHLAMAISVISAEIETLQTLLQNLDNNFDRAVTLLSSTKGRVVVTGVGKSGIIGRKISATLSSIGVASHFICPLDALHGDLGSVTSEDVIVMISNSGRTRELMELLPILRLRGIEVLALVGKIDSPLAQYAQISLSTFVTREACPYDIVPTSSTTAALVMGDALAICCAHTIGFSPEFFQVNHPQGTLGKKIGEH